MSESRPRKQDTLPLQSETPGRRRNTWPHGPQHHLLLCYAFESPPTL